MDGEEDTVRISIDVVMADQDTRALEQISDLMMDFRNKAVKIIKMEQARNLG